MMKIKDYFASQTDKIYGGHWDFPQGYFNTTEELGVRVYGLNGGNTAYQFLSKMGGYLKYIAPI